MSDSTAEQLDDIVRVDVPLRTEYASTLRILVASLAAESGFSVDEIDDLRLAVSEVFAVMSDADPNGRCTARLHVTADHLDLLISCDELEGPLELDPLASTILTSVLDEHHLLDNGVRLVKRATEASGA